MMHIPKTANYWKTLTLIQKKLNMKIIVSALLEGNDSRLKNVN